MTLSLVSERPRRRRGRGTFGRDDEDAIVVAMCAADATVAEIAAAVNRDTSYVYACVKRLHVQPRRLPVGRPAGQALRPACARCGVLLARAPAGDDGICGWCIEEEPQ